MAGVDTDFQGEAKPASGLRIGYLAQEPELNLAKDVLGNVEEGVSEIRELLTKFEEISAKFAEPMDDDEMNALLEQQGKLQEVEGRSLLPLLNSDTPIRQAGIYGVWASATNITDGRFTYFRYPDNMHAQEIYQYTLMPTHITSFFTTDELRTATLSPPFDFTKGVPVLKVSGHAKSPMYRNQGMSFFQDTETVLFDTKNDPEQRTPISSPEIVTRLVEQMLALMRVNDAPPEAYVRLGLGAPTSAAI